MTRPSKLSGHIAANALETAARNMFRAPIQHGFSASLIFCGNTAPSERSLTQRAQTPCARSACFAIGFLRHRGLAMVTVERHERLITRMLPALGADAGEYNAASVRKVILDQIRGCRPAHAKTIRRMRSASIYDSWQQVAHASLVSTMHCQPWPNGGFPRCPGTSTPNKWLASLTPVARTGRKG